MTPAAGPTRVHDLLDAAARRAPGRPALAMPGRRWTYGELAEVSHAFASWLLGQGVRAGDRVLVHHPNSMELAAMLFGTSRAGATYVPVSHEMTRYQLEGILAEAHPAVVVTGSPSSVYEASGVRTLAELWPEVELRRGDRVPEVAGAGDIALLLYTSGSTAAPKGVVCPHERVVFAARAIAARLGYRPDDRIFVRLPLSFDYGLYQFLLACLATASVHLGTDRSGAPLLRDLVASQATVVPVVPSLAEMLCALAERRTVAAPVRLFTNTGAALAPHTAARLRRSFPGSTVVFMFGLTECKRVSISEPDIDLRLPGSVGTPLDGTDVAIVDDDGRPLPPGEVGQIVVRGPHVMDGYYRDTDLGTERFGTDPADGARILRTGDFGYRDREGNLYFHGRRDDIFKRRGTRMSTTEIEAAVMAVPGVTAAVAVPSVAGERLRLAVVGDIAPDRLRHELAARLEPAKQPDECVLLACLPHTTNGKVDRSAVAAALERGTGK